MLLFWAYVRESVRRRSLTEAGLRRNVLKMVNFSGIKCTWNYVCVIDGCIKFYNYVWTIFGGGTWCNDMLRSFFKCGWFAIFLVILNGVYECFSVADISRNIWFISKSTFYNMKNNATENLYNFPNLKY